MITKIDHTLLLKIILPSDTMAEINAESVVIPGQEGVFGVLPGHTKFISSIKIGVINVHEKGTIKSFFVYGGVAQVNGQGLNIITEFAAALESTKRNSVLNNITALKSDLTFAEVGSVEARIINSKIEKYQSLLEFVETIN